MSQRRGTKALELWCRRMTEGYPGVKIDNMTTSWRDGLAFCAMIHHFRPELIEFDKLNKEDVYYNNELAFTTAEKYLGIPALLDADDMAAYAVPDRLSILTYLSQFYQAFGAQGSANRLKRPSSAVEKAQISKTAGPPAKMAHVVGVPRRDPCHKCKLPVFLAERLTVGKKIYHRRCLKCARCGSQLTPGSFYETEIDDQYCCETCPDEEIIGAAAAVTMDESGDNVVLRKGSENENETVAKDTIGVPTTEAGAAKPMRSSIAARLAFFEQNKENSLNANQEPIKDPFLRRLSLKNASDEDKSKNLLDGEVKYPSAFVPYKPNSAMSSFLYDAVDGDGGSSESTDTTEVHSPSKKHLGSKQESISDNEDGDLNMVVNEKVLRKKDETASPRLEGSPTFTTSVSLGSPQLAGSPTFTKPLNMDSPGLESSLTITKLNVDSPLLADSLTSNKTVNMDSPPLTGSPTFLKSSNMESPRSVGSPTINKSLDKESPRSMRSPTLNMDSPRSVGSPTLNKSLNMESPRSGGSPTSNKSLNKESPRSVGSPTYNKPLNFESPRSLRSPTYNKPLNMESPRSLGSPTYKKPLNMESPRSLGSPTLNKTLNKESSRSLGSPTFNKSFDMESPRSLGNPTLNKSLDMESPRSLGNPTLNKSLDMDSPRSLGNPTLNKSFNLTSSRLGGSPAFSSSTNERSISPAKHIRLTPSPTFTVKTELNLHPSPRLGASPTFTKMDNNTSVYDTPLFINEDEDGDKDIDIVKDKNVDAVESEESKNCNKIDEDDDVPLKINEALEPETMSECNIDLKNDLNNQEGVAKENNSSDKPVESSEHLIAIKAQELEKAMNKLTNESLIDESSDEVELRDPKRRFSKEYDEDKQTIERLSVVRARLQQFEAVVKANENENENLRSSPANDEKLDNDIATKNIDIQNEDHSPEDSNDVLESNVCPVQKEEVPILADSIEDHPMPDVTENDKDPLKEIPPEMETKTATESPVEMESENEIRTEEVSVVEEKEINKIEKVPEQILETSIEEKKEEEEFTPQEGIPNIPSAIVMPATSSSTLKPNDPRTTSKISIENYPKELDPFKSDTDEDDQQQGKFNTSTPRSTKAANKALNPFDSSDDEVELEKSSQLASPTSSKVPPPRPPPPRLSRNPFSEDTDEENNFTRRSSVTSSLTKKTPIPTPRRNLSKSQNPTPEPTPRLSSKITQNLNGSEYFGSDNSLSSALTTPSSSLQRNSEVRSSNNSLCSSFGGTMRSRKTRRAPLPPSMSSGPAPVKELFPSSETLNSSKTSTPSSSTRTSPKLHRKKRPAPAPPKPARLDPSLLPQITFENNQNSLNNNNTSIEIGESKNLNSYPLQSKLDSIYYDENKTLLEGKPIRRAQHRETGGEVYLRRQGSMRLIPLDASILDDPVDHLSKSDDFKHKLQQQEESQAVYRRILIPPKLDITPTHEYNPIYVTLDNERQIEKLKDNKEAQNRNRQSHNSTISSNDTDENYDNSIYYDKASQGKWKRRKGPAPALPIPPRKVLQMLPLQEIKHELEIIEVQQQGLEKQGVILEKMIRDRCEGANGEQLGIRNSLDDIGNKIDVSGTVQNSKEVEDLILQLFELVNEKNDLFRRQAELMYLRRQHRLEQEQADLEYEIRVLMAQPERNKTDSDKSREESLIARFIEVVRLRNEVIECLEMDRLREAEEDLSIKQRLEIHTANRRANDSPSQSGKMEKLSKKEKKKQKETKKLSKDKKIDVDKDADESELNNDKDKEKNIKKKKKFLFLSK